MVSITNTLRELAALVGQNWLVAAAAAFIVMVLESAKPSPVEGEDEPRASAFQRVAMIASLAVPLLLFLHAFGAFVLAQQARGEDSQSNGGVILALIAVAVAFVLLPGIIGWLIAKISPPLAHLLRAIAPALALAVFAFTVYVTYNNAFFVLNLYLLSRLH